MLLYNSFSLTFFRHTIYTLYFWTNVCKDITIFTLNLLLVLHVHSWCPGTVCWMCSGKIPSYMNAVSVWTFRQIRASRNKYKINFHMNKKPIWHCCFSVHKYSWDRQITICVARASISSRTNLRRSLYAEK